MKLNFALIAVVATIYEISHVFSQSAVTVSNGTINLTGNDSSNTTSNSSNATNSTNVTVIVYENISRIVCSSIVTASNSTFTTPAIGVLPVSSNNTNTTAVTNTTNTTKLRNLQTTNTITYYNYSWSYNNVTTDYINCSNTSLQTDATLKYGNKGVCPSINCVGFQSIYNGTCWLYDLLSTTTNISTCPANHYCPIKNFNFTSKLTSNSTNFTCKAFPNNVYSGMEKGTYVDYDYCEANSDCGGGNCTKNICYGKKENQTCVYNYECGANLYCDNKKLMCYKRKGFNSTCRSDGECTNSYGCFNSNCTEYFSLPNNSTINTKYTDDRIFCRSNYASKGGVCEDLVNTTPFPHYCNVSAGCTYRGSISNESVTIMSACNCDLSGNGNAFCQLDTNSSEYQDYLSSLKSLLNNECHLFNKQRCSLTPYSSVMNLHITSLRYSQLLSNSSNYSCLDPVEVSSNPVTFCKTNPCSSWSNSIIIPNLVLVIILCYFLLG